MNYVEQVMQRQSAAWLALFGGGSESAEEAAEATEPIRRESRETTDYRRTANGLAEDTSADAAESVEIGESERRPSGRTRAEEELLIRGREKLLRELAFARISTQENEESGGARKAGKSESLAAESAHWEAEAALREGRSDLETADARAISRRFERDARRYDGGFIFY